MDIVLRYIKNNKAPDEYLRLLIKINKKQIEKALKKNNKYSSYSCCPQVFNLNSKGVKATTNICRLAGYSRDSCVNCAILVVENLKDFVKFKEEPLPVFLKQRKKKPIFLKR